MSTQVIQGRGASLATHSLIAGIIGAIGTDAFISIAHHMSPVKLWQFIASADVGPVAFSSPTYALLGFVMHIITALVWALLYAFVWTKISSLRNWIAGGIIWGIVVDVCMDGVMAFRGVLEPQTASSIIFGLITNVVFYGLLVAFYLSRTVRESPATSK